MNASVNFIKNSYNIVKDTNSRTLICSSLLRTNNYYLIIFVREYITKKLRWCLTSKKNHEPKRLILKEAVKP